MTPRTRDSSMDCSVHSGVVPAWPQGGSGRMCQAGRSGRAPCGPPLRRRRRCRSTVCGGAHRGPGAGVPRRAAGYTGMRARSGTCPPVCGLPLPPGARSRRKDAALRRRRVGLRRRRGRHGRLPAITQENCPCGGGGHGGQEGPCPLELPQGRAPERLRGGSRRRRLHGRRPRGSGATRRRGEELRHRQASPSGPAARDMRHTAPVEAATTARHDCSAGRGPGGPGGGSSRKGRAVGDSSAGEAGGRLRSDESRKRRRVGCYLAVAMRIGPMPPRPRTPPLCGCERV